MNNEISETDRLMMVKEFQAKFRQDYDGPPRELPASVAALRIKLIMEEAAELATAISRGELHEQLDACIDLIYVAYGTVNAMGMTHVFAEAFDRVHRANMMKILTPSRLASKRDSQWDIIKPENWEKPDLTDLVRITP